MMDPKEHLEAKVAKPVEPGIYGAATEITDLAKACLAVIAETRSDPKDLLCRAMTEIMTRSIYICVNSGAIKRGRKRKVQVAESPLQNEG